MGRKRLRVFPSYGSGNVASVGNAGKSFRALCAVLGVIAMNVSSFIRSVKACEGSVSATPFAVLEDGRKVTYSVNAVKDLTPEQCASAITCYGAKGKISSGAAKDAKRGIPGSFELPASEAAGIQFIEAYESAAEVEAAK